MMAVTSKNDYLKWMMAVGIIIGIYALQYFYFMLPGSDSHFFRGLTEYFIQTRDLNPLIPNHFYFQWPSFFILTDIATSVSGLKLANYEFLQYAIIGFLLTTTLYVYASKVYKHGGFLAPVVFFIVMFYFLNYQNVPFSLALGLLFILFMLDTRQKNSSVILTMLILFVSISITHAFVPLFFVIYLLIQSILKRNKQYRNLFLLTSIIYFVVQFTIAQYSFGTNILVLMNFPTEYSSIAETILRPISVPIDVTAQWFSRTITIAFAVMSFFGFIFLLIRRKMRDVDKAIFLMGAVYSGLGIILFTLGSRAVAIAFIPVSLGASYLFESKFRPYLICILLILLSLFTFIPLHTSFGDSPIAFQTREAYTTANFVIDKYDWRPYSLVLSHVSVSWYILARAPQIEGNSFIISDYSSLSQGSNIEAYDLIVYSVGLEKTLRRYNVSLEVTSQRIFDRFNVIYNSGSSYVAEKVKVAGT
jgi:hypothetical protein